MGPRSVRPTWSENRKTEVPTLLGVGEACLSYVVLASGLCRCPGLGPLRKGEVKSAETVHRQLAVLSLQDEGQEDRQLCAYGAPES